MGKNACVVGRSHNVGLPIALILQADHVKGKDFLDPVMFSFSLGLLALYKDKAKRPKIEANQQVLKRSLFKGGLDLTTTICHRYTPKEELVEALSKADVVVSAAGVSTKNFHVVTSLIIL